MPWIGRAGEIWCKSRRRKISDHGHYGRISNTVNHDSWIGSTEDKIVLNDNVRTNVEVIPYQDSNRMLCGGHVNQICYSRAILAPVDHQCAHVVLGVVSSDAYRIAIDRHLITMGDFDPGEGPLSVHGVSMNRSNRAVGEEDRKSIVTRKAILNQGIQVPDQIPRDLHVAICFKTLRFAVAVVLDTHHTVVDHIPDNTPSLSVPAYVYCTLQVSEHISGNRNILSNCVVTCELDSFRGGVTVEGAPGHGCALRFRKQGVASFLLDVMITVAIEEVTASDREIGKTMGMNMNSFSFGEQATGNHCICAISLKITVEINRVAHVVPESDILDDGSRTYVQEQSMLLFA